MRSDEHDDQQRRARRRERPRATSSTTPTRVRTAGRSGARTRQLEQQRRRARRRFLDFYPGGFDDPDYLALERSYKAGAHETWTRTLSEPELAALLRDHQYGEIAARAVRIEGRTNLLFSFEKMALRDAVRSPEGAQIFAEGIYTMLHGSGDVESRFTSWIDAVSRLPRRQTRVLTWPVVTVFPFIADPKTHLYLKPNVTKIAAARWGFDFAYASRPSWSTYASLLAFGRDVKRQLATRFPGRARDQIDVQGFIWVLGSDEYD